MLRLAIIIKKSKQSEKKSEFNSVNSAPIHTEEMSTHYQVDKEQYRMEDCTMSHPLQNDVLSGRGKFAMFWHGNKYYRSLIEASKNDYIVANNTTKQLIAIKIIQEVRELSPPGRFLEFDPSFHQWRDIGEKKAIRKTRQALREGAPNYSVATEGNCFIHFIKTLNKNEKRSNSSTKIPTQTKPMDRRHEIRMKELNQNTLDSKPNFKPDIIVSDTSDEDYCGISSEFNNNID